MSNISSDTSLKSSLQRYNAAVDAEIQKHLKTLKELKNERGGYELFLQDTERSAAAKAREGVDFANVDLDNPNVSFSKFSAPAKDLDEAELDEALNMILREDPRKLSAIDLQFKQDYLALKMKFFDDKIYDIESEIVREVEKLTKELLKTLPMELQWLKALYTIGEYDQIIELIEKYLQIDQNDQEALSRFFKESAMTVDAQLTEAAIISLQRSGTQSHVSATARTEMRDKPAGALLDDDITERTQVEIDQYKKEINFSTLPEEIQKALIAQRKYVMELSAQLELSQIKPDDGLYKELQSYYKQLQDNIDNAMLNKKSLVNEQADFERIKSEIERRRDEIYRKAFRNTFFTSTNAKAACMMAAGYLVMPFLSQSSSFVTRVFILASLPGLYENANVQAKKIAQENISARTELIADEDPKSASAEKSFLKPVDIEYIYMLDQEFRVKSAKEMDIPEQNQKVGSQLFGAYSALWNRFPSGVKRVFVFAALMAPFAIAAPLAPVVWPILVAVGAALGVIGAALVNVPVGSYVKSAFGGMTRKASSVTLTSELSKPNPTANTNLITFTAEQKDSLNKLFKGLAEIVSKHFNDRLEELSTELDLLVNSPKANDEAVQKLTHEITQLEKDWEAVEKSIGNAKEFCAVMHNHIQRTYLAEREEFIDAKKMGIHPPKRRHLIFSGRDADKPAAVSPAPNFNIDAQYDYMQDREPLEDIVKLNNVIKHIERGLSA